MLRWVQYSLKIKWKLLYIRINLALTWQLKASSTSETSAPNTTLHCVMLHKNLYAHQHHSNLAYGDLLHKLTEKYTYWLRKISTPNIWFPVSKSQSTRLHHAAIGHICKLFTCSIKYTIIEAFGYFTYSHLITCARQSGRNNGSGTLPYRLDADGVQWNLVSRN
jgi:hypothetical protein